MSTGWYSTDTSVSLCAVKGAPESILPRCRADTTELMGTLDGLAAQGLRVLAVAQRLDLSLENEGTNIST